jgi:hypothetical protein
MTMKTTVKTTSLWIKFAGWFQCRLATDPDPTDEPRGVDGYIHAIAGEPDLDRIIRLQPHGTVQRSHCPDVRVKVIAVYEDQHKIDDHPLIDGNVDFLDNPKFEGRNNILAEGGKEAIFPLNIQIKKNRCKIQRNFDDSIKFPPFNQEDRDKFMNLQASGININPGIVGEATGIFDLANVWDKRIADLQSDLAKTTNEIEKASIESRIELMSKKGIAQRFSARMLYSMSLTGNASFEDPDGYFAEKLIMLAPEDPWILEFWCGAWDADAQSGYIVGYVNIPVFSCISEEKNQVYDALHLNQDLAKMISNPLERRL